MDEIRQVSWGAGGSHLVVGCIVQTINWRPNPNKRVLIGIHRYKLEVKPKQAVGGRHDMPRPRPATEARSGSLEPGQPSRARSVNTHHPAGRQHTMPADQMYATDVRQTDVRQHHCLIPPGGGITNGYSQQSMGTCEFRSMQYADPMG